MTSKDDSYKQGKFILAMGVVIFAIGQSLLFIVITPLARKIGLDERELGYVFALANISLIMAGPYWGRRSDVIGRKPVFIIGLMGSAIGILLMAWTLDAGLSGTFTGSMIMIMIFLSRFAYGLTASSIYPSASGYIADVTDWQNRAKGMAMVGSANGIGSVLGPALGAGLVIFGVLAPMYVAAG